MTRIFFYLIATIIMYQIELPYSYSNYFELVIGYAVTNIMLSFIDFIIYKIAYSITGNYGVITDASSEQKGIFHWKVRCILAIVLCLFTYLPICSSITTYITHHTYLFFVDKYNELVQIIISTITP